MSKPVYKNLMMASAALADLYIEHANKYAELAKEDPPFPDMAARVDPTSESVDDAPELPPAAPAPTPPAPTPPALAAPPIPATDPLAAVAAESQAAASPELAAPPATPPAALVEEPAPASAPAEDAERKAASALMYSAAQAFTVPWMQNEIMPHFQVADVNLAPIANVRALVAHITKVMKEEGLLPK